MTPQVGEVWFVDFGYDNKPRYGLVVASEKTARLAMVSVVTITTQYGGTPFEVTLPRVPWLREQSYVNAQSVQPVKITECVRLAPGKFDVSILSQVQKAIKLWFRL